MSVTITITVSDSGAAVVAAPAEGADATSGEGAPPPSLVGSPDAATSTAEDAVGPPPVEFAQLGLGDTTLATTGTGAPPAPAEFVEAAAESGDKPPEPMAVEELNKTTSRGSSTRKKAK